MGLKDIQAQEYRRHPQLWFEDGDVLVKLEDGRICKVHQTLLEWSSPKQREHPVKVINGGTDWEPLLEYIYQIRPLGDESSIQCLSQILSVSHEKSGHFPEIYELAVAQIVKRYPSDPRPASYGTWTGAKEATKLCLRYGIKEPLKPLFYALITHSDINAETHSDFSSSQLEKLTDARLKAAIAKRCMYGMREIMDHFSPILFTPPPASHMECTDIIADKWMPLVLQPAIDGGGMYKPLETLKAMREVDWNNAGVCASCIAEKRKEWSDEAEIVWNKLEDWLDL